MSQLRSTDCQAAAHALRRVRARLVQPVSQGSWPEGSFPGLTTVQVHGLEVAEALERLAQGREPPRPAPGPYDPDQRL